MSSGVNEDLPQISCTSTFALQNNAIYYSIKIRNNICNDKIITLCGYLQFTGNGD